MSGENLKINKSTSSQLAVWRKRGAKCKLENVVQISPACAKPPGRCVQAPKTLSRQYHLEKIVLPDNAVDKSVNN